MQMLSMPEPGRVLTREEVEKSAQFVARSRFDVPALARSHEQQRDHCPLCGHEWRRHDPEDGMCDAGMPQALDHDGLGACPCGRNIGYMRRRIATLSRAALSAGEEKQP